MQKNRKRGDAKIIRFMVITVRSCDESASMDEQYLKEKNFKVFLGSQF